MSGDGARPALTLDGSTLCPGGDSDFDRRRDEDPMNPDEFSALAVGLGPSVHVKPILEAVQFRVGGKAFATLGWPATGWAVVKVAPSRQVWALSLSAGLAPEPGRRRKSGIVLMQLAAIDEAVAVDLLADAWSFAHRSIAPRARGTAASTGRALSA
ncbi:MmcQ/YjbR family DNA-binding protein [Caulobacter sp. CCH9-E1]|jgi:hypothetical protein|uniref:MmcQ/YjbR family DNA-binding protein n=2 Tax=Caulobacter TaxID=75 RepID=UPI000A8B7C45|nr:MmcQ/YjbR family DNA-binding protein [Caulobacter sp. CCH9-E1]